jgi:hypothetical protein
VLGCSDSVAVPGRPKAPWRPRKAATLQRLAGENDPDMYLVSACDKLHNTRDRRRCARHRTDPLELVQ